MGSRVEQDAAKLAKIQGPIAMKARARRTPRQYERNRSATHLFWLAAENRGSLSQ